MAGGYIYILASKSGVLYIGVTSSLEDRIRKHRSKTADSFTKQYNVTRLVHSEYFRSIQEAIAREKQLKGWRRSKKIALIELQNSSWKDLAETLPLAQD